VTDLDRWSPAGTPWLRIVYASGLTLDGWWADSAGACCVIECPYGDGCRDVWVHDDGHRLVDGWGREVHSIIRRPKVGRWQPSLLEEVAWPECGLSIDRTPQVVS
jgi:hypothetical protein